MENRQVRKNVRSLLNENHINILVPCIRHLLHQHTSCKCRFIKQKCSRASLQRGAGKRSMHEGLHHEICLPTSVYTHGLHPYSDYQPSWLPGGLPPSTEPQKERKMPRKQRKTPHEDTVSARTANVHVVQAHVVEGCRRGCRLTSQAACAELIRPSAVMPGAYAHPPMVDGEAMGESLTRALLKPDASGSRHAIMREFLGRMTAT
jgi:hypothetical protein